MLLFVVDVDLCRTAWDADISLGGRLVAFAPKGDGIKDFGMCQVRLRTPNQSSLGAWRESAAGRDGVLWIGNYSGLEGFAVIYGLCRDGGLVSSSGLLLDCRHSPWTEGYIKLGWHVYGTYYCAICAAAIFVVYSLKLKSKLRLRGVWLCRAGMLVLVLYHGRICSCCLLQ